SPEFRAPRVYAAEPLANRRVLIDWGALPRLMLVLPLPAPLNWAVSRLPGTAPVDQLVGGVVSDQRLETAPVQVAVVWAKADGAAVSRMTAQRMAGVARRRERSMLLPTQ